MAGVEMDLVQRHGEEPLALQPGYRGELSSIKRPTQYNHIITEHGSLRRLDIHTADS